MPGINDILRLSGGIKRDPAVDIWLSDGPIELRSIAQKWFAQMRQCGDDVRELIHDGCPVACVEDAPFGYVNSFKSHVNVGFFFGAMLEDPAGISTAALRALIDAAYVDIRQRLGAERSWQEG